MRADVVFQMQSGKEKCVVQVQKRAVNFMSTTKCNLQEQRIKIGTSNQFEEFNQFCPSIFSITEKVRCTQPEGSECLAVLNWGYRPEQLQRSRGFREHGDIAMAICQIWIAYLKFDRMFFNEYAKANGPEQANNWLRSNLSNNHNRWAATNAVVG